MFESVGFVVDFVPAESEGFDEVQLDEAMMTQDLERNPQAGSGQFDAVVGGMLHEVQICQ